MNKFLDDFEETWIDDIIENIKIGDIVKSKNNGKNGIHWFSDVNLSERINPTWVNYIEPTYEDYITSNNSQLITGIEIIKISNINNINIIKFKKYKNIWFDANDFEKI